MLVRHPDHGHGRTAGNIIDLGNVDPRDVHVHRQLGNARHGQRRGRGRLGRRIRLRRSDQWRHRNERVRQRGRERPLQQDPGRRPGHHERRRGNDTITFSGTSNGIVTATPTSINNLDGSNPVAEIEGAVFNAPFQENTFDLTDAPFPSTVNGNGSNDVFYSSAFNDTFNGGGQGLFDIVGAKTDSASIVLTNTSMSGAGIGTDTITGAERAQILSPSVLGTSMAVVNSTWDASAFTGPVDLEGGTGNDTLIGGSASDTLGAPVMNPTGSVEEGDDTLIGNGSGDTLRGGPGTDTARATGVTSGVVNASNMNANGIDSFNSIEVASLTGTAGADTMNGSAFGGRVIFDGAAGNDMLTGSGQNDEITGGADNDTMNAGGGIDRLIETAVAATSATLTDTALSGFGGAPNETISGFELATLNGSADADTFDASGFSGAVTLVGADGGDTLTGGSGADSFSGGAGDDTLNALDSVADASIDCGADNDSAQTDPVDPTALGCETVNGQPTGGGPGTGPGTGPGGGETLDTTAPLIGVSAGRVNRRGRLPLRFTCPATEQSCSGTFVLRLAGKKTKLGSGRFTVRGGEVVLVKMKLTRRGRALLRKRGRLRATLRLTVTDAAGNRGSLRKSLRLRPAG